MNNAEILNNRKQEIIEDSDRIKGKMIRNIAIAYLTVGALIVPAILLKEIFYNLTFPLISFATVIPTLSIYDIVVKYEELKQNGKEIKHLENISKQGIKKTDELDRKRLEKIEDLKDEQAEHISKDKLAARLSAIPILGWFGASCATIFSFNAMYVALGAVGLMSLLCAKSAHEEKELIRLESRINNLENDLLLEPIYGYTPEPEKTVIKVKSQETPSAKEKENDKKAEAVDQYVESLTETTRKEQEKPKEKVIK